MSTKYPNHSAEITRLKRIRGQIDGIIKMIEEGKYCVDIINQLSAAYSAVASARTAILQRHLECCIKNAIDGKTNDKSDKITELMDLLKRF